MSPRSHPDDDGLLAYVTGAMPPGGALTVELHLAHCAQCRAAVRFMDALGGALLERADPDPVDPAALAHALARIAATPMEAAEAAPLPAPARAVAALRHGPWRPFLPGLEVADVEGAFEADETVCLLKGKAGSAVPTHTHSRIERFVVLEGAFGVDDTVYTAGDYIEADGEVVHTPFAPATSDCLCLFALQGRLVFAEPRKPA